MIQIDLLKIWDFIKKWGPSVLFLVFAILYGVKFIENNTLSVDNEKLKNSVLRSEILSKGYLDLVANKNKTISKNEKDIDSLNAEIQKSKTKVLVIKEESIKKQKQVSSYSTEQLAAELRDRYSPKESIQTVGDNIVSADTISKQIVSDLYKKDYLSLELMETNKTLLITEEKSKEQDSVISDLKDQKKNLFLVVEENDKIKKDQAKIISNAENQLKTEKRSKNIWKATAIGGAAILVIKSIIKK